MTVRQLQWNAAALSFLVPGWGQFEQHRARAGAFFMAWAVLSVLLALFSPLLGIPTSLVWLDLVAVTLWSSVDALVASA